MLHPAAMSEPSAPTSQILRRIARDYLRDQRGTLILAIAFMALYAICTAALAWLLGPATGVLFGHQSAATQTGTAKMLFGEGRAIWSLPLSVVAILWIRAVAYYVQQSRLDSIGERVVTFCQRDMFHALVRRDLAALNAVHSGTFVSNFLYDATLMRDAISRGVAAVALELVQLIALIAVMIYADWQLMVIGILAVPGVAWAMGKIGGSIKRTTQRNMEQTGSLSTAIAEALDGRRVIKAYGLEAHVSKAADARLSERLKHLVKLARRRASAVPVTDIFSGLVSAGVIYYALYQTAHGEVSADQFITFMGAMLLALQPIRNLSQVFTIASSGLTAANRVFAVIDAKPEIVDAQGAKDLAVTQGGAVRFENVSFAYAETPAVRGIDLEIAPGSKVALVGPSGSGKTTLFNLLLRFYEAQAGRITIDGQDIRGVTLQSLRGAIALVTQEPILFDESIATNIAMGRPGATRAEIEQAAKDAAAHEFITALPQGYDTKAGEGGLKLSGGQRQRIAIARAMLRNAPILLLDEATSALDTESERQVQEALTRLMKNRTTIVIAHRLSTVADADKLYVLDQGRVAEAGNHAELLALNGLYARLYQHDEPLPAEGA
ncbi:subfamily B ATP-binding cassette protein MsbA [Rhizomicrobium palustre]|uniref:Subfamily B ATP-binding cassette protein MsbA n=1 Tax=Rhizomicrobium palustre TaxID=189966 RepID=A0A846N0T7_9PROT|nr:ABC transporter ATP-binding protein [Rhizomicrobium palustre]NIK89316.1 subfamily B ATP-binding cassette protein MsbA [Rhizomicrobium palustre]